MAYRLTISRKMNGKPQNQNIFQKTKIQMNLGPLIHFLLNDILFVELT